MELRLRPTSLKYQANSIDLKSTMSLGNRLQVVNQTGMKESLTGKESQHFPQQVAYKPLTKKIAKTSRQSKSGGKMAQHKSSDVSNSQKKHLLNTFTSERLGTAQKRLNNQQSTCSSMAVISIPAEKKKEDNSVKFEQYEPNYASQPSNSQRKPHKHAASVTQSVGIGLISSLIQSLRNAGLTSSETAKVKGSKNNSMKERTANQPNSRSIVQSSNDPSKNKLSSQKSLQSLHSARGLNRQKRASEGVKKVLSPVGSMKCISNAFVGVPSVMETGGRSIKEKAYASVPQTSKKGQNQSVHSNGQQSKGIRQNAGQAKAIYQSMIPGKKKSSGGLYLKSQSSEQLSGNQHHGSKKILVRNKQSASQTILKTADPQIPESDPMVGNSAPHKKEDQQMRSSLVDNELILSKVICMQEQEQAEAERAAALQKAHLEIVNKKVDQLYDLVASQQAHIKNLEAELAQAIAENIRHRAGGLSKLSSLRESRGKSWAAGNATTGGFQSSSREKEEGDSATPGQPAPGSACTSKTLTKGQIGSNGMIRCGSSQLNQKLEKMKSTPDLLGDFRNAVAGGENLKDYIMCQKSKEQLNLEYVIKELIMKNAIPRTMSSTRQTMLQRSSSKPQWPGVTTTKIGKPISFAEEARGNAQRVVQKRGFREDLPRQWHRVRWPHQYKRTEHARQPDDSPSRASKRGHEQLQHPNGDLWRWRDLQAWHTFPIPVQRQTHINQQEQLHAAAPQQGQEGNTAYI